MTDTALGKGRAAWPPLIYVLAIVAGAVLTSHYRLPWFSGPLADILYAVGWLLVIGTIALYVAVWRTLARVKKTIGSFREPAHLVTDGPFGFTRNPIFLADTILVLGIGLITGSTWTLMLAFVAAFITSKFAIEREERHFTDRFGKRYRDYAKRVRRWV